MLSSPKQKIWLTKSTGTVIELISKDTFIGIMMSNSPHVIWQKARERGEEGKYVEAFWLIPVEGRAEIFDAFAKQNDLRLGSPYSINGVEYIRIQNRKTLNALLMMVPPCLIDANQRVKAFVEVMQMINSKEHLTQEGRNKIELLKQNMHKWYSKDSEHYTERKRWAEGWKQ